MPKDEAQEQPDGTFKTVQNPCESKKTVQDEGYAQVQAWAAAMTNLSTNLQGYCAFATLNISADQIVSQIDQDVLIKAGDASQLMHCSSGAASVAQ